MGEKFSQYECILYPENMIPDWKDDFSDYVPYRSVVGIHDDDYENGELKKEHLHLIMVTDSSRNRTTGNHFIEVANRLSKPGCKCCSVGKPVYNIEQAYKYLLHDTPAALRAGKTQYDESHRICFNGFEITDFIKISDKLQDEILESIINVIVRCSISNMADVWPRLHGMSENFGYEYQHMFLVFKKYNSIIGRMTQGVYHKEERKLEKWESKLNADALEIANFWSEHNPY